jgi:hypothetical protein
VKLNKCKKKNITQALKKSCLKSKNYKGKSPKKSKIMLRKAGQSPKVFFFYFHLITFFLKTEIPREEW